MLEPFTAGTFRVRFEGHAPLKVELVSAEKVGASSADRPFSVMFRGPKDLRLVQSTYPDDIHKDEEHRHAMIAGRTSGYSVQKRYLLKDGRSAWISLNISLVRGGSGSLAYFVAVVEDVRKETEIAAGSLTAREREVLWP